MIAWFGEVFGGAPGKTEDADRQELDQLVTARLGLTRLQGQIEGWGSTSNPRWCRRSIRRCSRR
jgi:hypothetical protein